MKIKASHLLPLALAMVMGQKLGEPEPEPVAPRPPVRCRLCGIDCRGNKGCSIQAHALLKGWKRYDGAPKEDEWACPTCREKFGAYTAAREVCQHSRLSKADFDKIAARHGVDPDDDGLVHLLHFLGWTFCPGEDLYVGPEEL